MTFPANPFKPTSGVMPPVLIGRESVIADFDEGLGDGPGAPDRLMLITGPRGSGKTVMLTKLGKIAAKHRWMVVDETASAGLTDRLISRIAPDPGRIAGVSIKPSRTCRPASNRRRRMRTRRQTAFESGDRLFRSDVRRRRAVLDRRHRPAHGRDHGLREHLPPAAAERAHHLLPRTRHGGFRDPVPARIPAQPPARLNASYTWDKASSDVEEPASHSTLYSHN